MSILLYAQLTTKRDDAPVGESRTTAPPGLGTTADALAALVPAEVLALHAVVISLTTTTTPFGTAVANHDVLWWSFWGLVLMAGGLYAGWRLYNRRWDHWDWLRVLIPPLSFVAWTMIQRMTAFDAVAPNLDSSARSVIAVFLGPVLGVAASMLAFKADQTNPNPPPAPPVPPVPHAPPVPPPPVV